MIRYLLLLFTASIVYSGFSQTGSFNCYVPDEQAAIREHNVDFISMELDVQFQPTEGKVIGQALYLFTALQGKVDSLFLDGPGILVQNIFLDNSKTKFRLVLAFRN